MVNSIHSFYFPHSLLNFYAPLNHVFLLIYRRFIAIFHR
nr:MAG TPA: hypothetical protein [Caudoviricetes sp.]